MSTLKKLTRNNIWTALEDYFRHTESNEVYDNISDNFVERLASDSIKSKRELRELFCKSQGWDENLQAIVINGTKTHNPDYILVHNLANSILRPAKWDADCDKLRTGHTLTLTLRFPFATITFMTLKFLLSELTACVFPAATKFTMDSFATIAITMTANFVKNAKIILLKRGKFSISAAKLFAFVKSVLTNIIVFANTAMNIILVIRLLLPVMVPLFALNDLPMILPFVTNAMNISCVANFLISQILTTRNFFFAKLVAIKRRCLHEHFGRVPLSDSEETFQKILQNIQGQHLNQQR